MAVLGLRFCARAFSSCSKRGPLFIAVCGPLTIVASLVAEHRLQTRRLSSCGSRAQPLRGMWDPPRPDQGPNPCPLHWQADSQPLRHQRSPVLLFWFSLCGSFYKEFRNILWSLFLDLYDNSRRWILISSLYRCSKCSKGN